MSIAKPATTQKKLGSQILLESGTNELEVLVFHLNDLRYGINGAKVREVVNPPAVRPVPGAHESLDGLCKLRDDVIPMVSLRKYLKLPAIGVDPAQVGDDSSQVIVTVFNEQSIAFRVDRVDRIYRISWKNMRPIPDLCEGDRNQYTGLTVIDDEIILMIDLEKISEEINERVTRLSRLAERSGKPLEGKRIVYAEDSQIIQGMTTDLLRAAGVADLHVFNNGEHAWKWLEKNIAGQKVDAVVTDIEMPLMDGLHLANRIRQHPGMKSLPIVLLSSLISPENEKKGKAVGVNAQLVKSKIEQLPDTLAGLFE